ncbi:MAG: hypothetical protein NUV65_05310 [Candidatus Roizmanbacteria bacterium]|nr:hypothetical protein [Candidatus Roizmanbacteria bacterium]
MNSLLKIPYVSAPENGCALACYTMIAKYFFPETTFEQIAAISQWKKSYVVWGFSFWLWLMNKNISVTDYDLIDYESWSKKGIEGLKTSVSNKTFDYLEKNTYDLTLLTEQIKQCMNNEMFIYHRQKTTYTLLEKEIAEGNPCEVVLNSHALNKVSGFALHRVVVLDIAHGLVTFHDPQMTPRPHRKETIKDFCHAWLEAQDEPELCIYRNIRK